MSDIVKLIEHKIASSRVIEAGTLLRVHEDNLETAQVDRLRQMIDQKLAQAEKLHDQAMTAEAHGSLDQALLKMQEATDIVGDNPELHAKIRELEDATELAMTFQKKVERRRREPGHPATRKKKNRRPLILGTVLICLGLAGWLLLQPGTGTPPSIKKDDTSLSQNRGAEKLEENTPAPTTTVGDRLSGEYGKAVPDGKSKPVAVNAIQKSDQQPSPDRARPKTEKQQQPSPSSLLIALPARPESDAGVSATAVIEDKKIETLLPEMEVKNELRDQVDRRPPPPPTHVPEQTEPDDATVAQSKPSIPVQTTSQEEQQVPDPTTASPRPKMYSDLETYVVEKGDSLSAIAQRLFCNQQDWEVLFQLNSDKILDPDLILPGTILRIRIGTVTIENRCSGTGTSAGSISSEAPRKGEGR